VGIEHAGEDDEAVKPLVYSVYVLDIGHGQVFTDDVGQ
jgi:hypothetical protein